jgi:hypothetical protein
MADRITYVELDVQYPSAEDRLFLDRVNGRRLGFRSRRGDRKVSMR